MNSLVGFTIFTDISQDKVKAVKDAQDLVITQFNHLRQRSLNIGDSCLYVWGSEEGMENRIKILPDGGCLVVIGSPHGRLNLHEEPFDIFSNTFELPWDGRVILLHVSADGKTWTMWNDWVGSIPVFHAEVGKGRVASSLEPVTVSAAGFTPADFFNPGLISFLINGHFISDWTLYKGMKTVLPDSRAVWDENGYRVQQVWSVKPSQARWEAGWDDMVDEMYELSHQVISDILKTQPSWTLPLSSGLDSRLIAAVAADIGSEMSTYAYGAANTTDVLYSQQVAKTLGFPWKHVNIPSDFLMNYTRRWADWYGSSLHFHGMYQMGFLDELKDEGMPPLLSGFIGDTLSGGALSVIYKLHQTQSTINQIGSDWVVFWKPDELRSIMKVPIEDAIDANISEIKKIIENAPGVYFQKLQFLRLWGRQHLFTSFQGTLSDYWCGVATPFLNKEYARFCLSLPLAALDNRQLLKDVFRRYYGPLAVIPGTYAENPMILTGRYLLNKRISKHLPQYLRRGPFGGFETIELRLDIASIQSTGRHALWPLFDAQESLSEWLDFSQLERDFQAVMTSHEDVRPLRRLQSAQTLAYRLLSE